MIHIYQDKIKSKGLKKILTTMLTNVYTGKYNQLLYEFIRVENAIMLKRTFFLIIIFVLVGSPGFCKMKGLSDKQLQNFVSNESICYEKIVKACDESDKPEAVRETSKTKEKDQLETLEDTLDNMRYSTEVAPPVNNVSSGFLNKPPTMVYINVHSNGQHDTQVVK